MCVKKEIVSFCFYLLIKRDSFLKCFLRSLLSLLLLTIITRYPIFSILGFVGGKTGIFSIVTYHANERKQNELRYWKPFRLFQSKVLLLIVEHNESAVIFCDDKILSE